MGKSKLKRSGPIRGPIHEESKAGSARDTPSGGAFLGLPLVVAAHEDTIETHGRDLEEIKTELAKLKTEFGEIKRLFYLPGSEGGGE